MKEFKVKKEVCDTSLAIAGKQSGLITCPNCKSQKIVRDCVIKTNCCCGSILIIAGDDETS